MLLIGAVSFGMTSCNDDNDSGDPSDPDATEAGSAWVTGFRAQLPQGRVFYLSVTEELPESYDISSAVEVGSGGIFFESFGDNPYTIDNNAQTITKWHVDRSTLELSVEGLLSYASTGIGNVREPVFVSETKAYMIQLQEGLIVEFNPSTMQLNQTINVEPIEDSQLATVFTARDDKILIPVFTPVPDECCVFNSPKGAILAKFDTTTNTLEYVVDNRAFGLHPRLVVGNNGSMYIQPGTNTSIVDGYFDLEPEDGNPYLLLRVNDDMTIDPDFSLDLSEIVPMNVYQAASFIFDDVLVFNYVDDSNPYPEAYSDWPGLNAFSQPGAINLETGTRVDFTALEGFQRVFSRGIINGFNYFFASSLDGNETFILKQNSLTDFEIVTTISDAGSLRHVNQLW